MYAHVRDQASSSHRAAYPNSQYSFTTPNGSGFAYDTTIYPAIRSTPLSIPKTSSSSLASALDPAPEPDYNRAPAASSQVVERVGVQFNPGAFVIGAASGAGDMVYQGAASGRFTSDVQQPTDPSISLRAQHQMYHAGNAQNQPQPHFAYTQTNVSLPSSSSYTQSHQPNTYMRSDEHQWESGVGYSGYPTSLGFSSVASTASNLSQYPFSNDYSFTPLNEGERPQGVYDNGDGWLYSQPGTSFPTTEAMYFDFNQPGADASNSPWFSSPVGPQTGISTEPNTPFFGSSMSGQQFEPGTGAGLPSSSRMSEVEVGPGTLGKDHGTQATRPSIEDNSTPDARKQYQPSASRIDEPSPQSLAHTGAHQSAPSLQPTPRRAHSAQSSPQVTQSSGPLQLRGHNVLMPPPPLPPRAQTSAPERPESSNRGSQGGLLRRHTVTTPLGRVNDDESNDSSPTSSLATASARPSSAAPGSSSSPSLRDEAGEESPTTPRLATLTLNDAQWVHSQQRNRRSLKETFSLAHGHDPPSEMRIKQTSALERSVRNDVPLFTSPVEETGPKSDHAPDMGAETAEVPVRVEPSSASPEEMSEEESFGLIPGNWGLAQSALEIGQRPTAPRTHPESSSLVSPISPTTTDELITSGAPSLRRPRMNYAYETPANPEALSAPPSVSIKGVLSVIRHDGHLPSHVSGLGGTFVEAYDGRSYLTDDSELDPIHLPPCPPGARIGDHPALETVLPHPLAKRGQAWHDLLNPSKLRKTGKCPDQQQDTGNDSERDDLDKPENADPSSSNEERAVLKECEEAGVKKEEKGEGWGFVEGGSHGPQMALPEKDKGGLGPRQAQRLKLSTDKKTPPKMACHFCRNRKIACGASKCGDPTICNQCERRNIRCIFPTMSRRGMRTRNPRSAHTVDGRDEADKDSVDHDEDPRQPDGRSANEEPSSSTGTKKTPKPKRPYEKGIKEKETPKGKGRGKGSRKAEGSRDHGDSSERMGASSDETSGKEPYSDVQDVTPSGNDDPLASLAAEMQWSQQQDETSITGPSMQLDTGPSTTFPDPSCLSTNSLTGALHFPSNTFENSFPGSLPADTYNLQIGSSAGPFTTSPLQRRG